MGNLFCISLFAHEYTTHVDIGETSFCGSYRNSYCQCQYIVTCISWYSAVAIPFDLGSKMLLASV